jgi:hypothetical protein
MSKTITKQSKSALFDIDAEAAEHYPRCNPLRYSCGRVYNMVKHHVMNFTAKKTGNRGLSFKAVA